MAQFDRALDTVMDASMTRIDDGFRHETPSHRPPPEPYVREQTDSLLQLVARERDELAAHAEMLRRELDEMRARAARSTAPRELAELREQLGQREREIKRLKDSNVARERLLVEARERADRLAHERGAFEQRLALRERTALEWEARLHALQADAATLSSERDESRRLLEQAQTQLATERNQVQAQLATERNRAVREQAALREQVTALELARRELELAQTARIAELTGELSLAREALTRREAELRQEFDTRVFRALDERTRELGAMHEQELSRKLARAEGNAQGAVFALREEAADAMAKLRASHAREFDELFVANGTLLSELERGRERALADAERAREKLAAEVERVREQTAAEYIDRCARLEGRLLGERFAHAERMDDQLRRHSIETLELQRECQSRLNALLDELEAANGELSKQLERANVELSKQLESARVVAAANRTSRETLEGRVSELERRIRETALQRDQVAEQLAQAMSKLGSVRKNASEEAVHLGREAKKLAALVGELTFEVVEQTALRSAAVHQRARPTVFDVDEALTRVAERVPDDVAEQLWASRDRLLESLCARVDDGAA